MNYLAHLYLSGENPEMQIGNFAGDFVKGRNPENEFPKNIAIGIHLHRFIDRFTDCHPVVRESKNRLRPTCRHYSGVIVDIFYDHFLAKNWSRHHHSELRTYAHQFYNLSKGHESWLPEKARFVLSYMQKNDWLTSYSLIEGIEKVLQGMARRTSYQSGMETAVYNLLDNYTEFEKEYLQFMPELVKQSELYRYQLLNQFSKKEEQS